MSHYKYKLYGGVSLSTQSPHIYTYLHICICCIHIIYVFIALMFEMRTARAALLLGPW